MSDNELRASKVSDKCPNCGSPLEPQGLNNKGRFECGSFHPGSTDLCKTRAELNKANEEIRRLKEAFKWIENEVKNGFVITPRGAANFRKEILAKAKEVLG